MKTLEEKRAYIAAFIDGEGHIGNHLCANGHYSRSIGFCNTDKSLVDVMEEFLNDCGFPIRKSFDTPKNGKWSARWTVYISGGKKYFELFENTIPIQSERKKQTLRNMIEEYSKAKELLHKKKAEKMLPCQFCKILFYTSASLIKRGGGKFCSKKCNALAKQKRSARVCQICSKVYTVLTSSKSKFCSMSCAGKNKADRVASMSQMAARKRWNIS